MRTTTTAIALLAVMAASAQTVNGRVYSHNEAQVSSGDSSTRITQRANGAFRAEGTKGYPMVLTFSAPDCRTKTIVVPVEVLRSHHVSLVVTMEPGDSVTAVMTEDQYGILRATPQ
jgi:hypothetical protein